MQHAEACSLEPRARRGEQPEVLEAAAREDDRPRLAGLGARVGGARPRRPRGRRPRSRRAAGRRRGRRATAATSAAPSPNAPVVGLGAACRPRAARARSRPDPRSVTRSRTPRTAATASNRRPIPDESGAFTRQALAHQRPSAPTAPAAPQARGTTAADRHGSPDRGLAAGERHRRRGGRAARSRRGRSGAARRPRASRRCRSRCRRRRARAPAPVSPCSARQAAAWAWWCWTPTSSASCSSAHFVARYSGWRSCAITSGSTSSIVEVELEVGAERAVGQLGVEVAEVRREERVAAARDAEGALQLGAGRDDRRGAPRPAAASAAGRVAARAAERERGAHDRVLAAAVDRPVVAEERVGDPAEPLAASSSSKAIGSSERLPLVITSARAEVREQQVVERRVRAASARATATPGRDRRRDRRARRRRRTSTIGRSRDASSARLVGVELASSSGLGRHHRERLVLAVLARAQPRDRLLVRRRRRRGGSRRGP